MTNDERGELLKYLANLEEYCLALDMDDVGQLVYNGDRAEGVEV